MNENDDMIGTWSRSLGRHRSRVWHGNSRRFSRSNMLKNLGWLDLGGWGWFRGGRRLEDDDFSHGSGRWRERMQSAQLDLKVLGGDFVQRTGRHLGLGNAQFLGFLKNFFVLDSNLLCYVVNANGHITEFFGLRSRSRLLAVTNHWFRPRRIRFGRRSSSYL